MVLGIDIDSTITATGEKTRECLKQYAPEYDDYHKLPEDKYEEFLYIYGEYIHKTCELKPGVKEAFEYFNKNGYKIIIITARNCERCNREEEITKDYFKRHNLKYDKIIFDMTKKGKRAYENGVSIFFDDREENLDDVSSYGIECIRFTTKNDSKYKTFSNWYDIIEYVKSRKD